MSKEYEYTITLTIKDDMMTERARAVVPAAIKRALQELKAKMMLVSGSTSFEMHVFKETYTDGRYHHEDLELRDDADTDDGEA